MSIMESQKTITEFLDDTFGKARSNLSIAIRANKEMAELLSALSQDDNNPKAVSEIADVMIILTRLGSYLGVNVQQAINDKMKINRHREWELGGDSHAQHVKLHCERCTSFDVEEGGDYYIRCLSCGYRIGWN